MSEYKDTFRQMTTARLVTEAADIGTQYGHAVWKDPIAAQRLHTITDVLQERFDEAKAQRHILDEENKTRRDQVDQLTRENVVMNDKLAALVEEINRLKSGYPQNTKAMLDKICELTRKHEQLAHKLSRKSEELATLRKQVKRDHPGDDLLDLFRSLVK